MKYLCPSLLLLVALGPSTAHGESPTNDPIYGIKSISTISVHITGEGIRSPGFYNIESGSTLHDLIANDRAVWMKSSNGTFQIHRVVNEKKITITIDYTKWDIKLIDGDDIYAPGMQIPKEKKTTEPN